MLGDTCSHVSFPMADTHSINCPATAYSQACLSCSPSSSFVSQCSSVRTLLASASAKLAPYSLVPCASCATSIFSKLSARRTYRVSMCPEKGGVSPRRARGSQGSQGCGNLNPVEGGLREQARVPGLPAGGEVRGGRPIQGQGEARRGAGRGGEGGSHQVQPAQGESVLSSLPLSLPLPLTSLNAPGTLQRARDEHSANLLCTTSSPTRPLWRKTRSSQREVRRCTQE